jgi:trk system potassium uptake protein TrkA
MERIAVIGLGNFGTLLARRLAEAGADVLAIDNSREAVEEIRDDVALAVCLDSTDADALRAQGVDRVDVAVVSIGDSFESAALTTAILNEIGVGRIVARATTDVRARILAKTGADDIVNPEREASERWQHRLMAAHIMERIELAEGYSLVQVGVPAAFCGKSLANLDVRNRYGVNIVAVRRPADETNQTHEVLSVPNAETTLAEGDVLVLIGSDQDIGNFPTA